MSGLIARTTPLPILVLIVFVGDIAQTARAEDELAFDYKAISAECAEAGDGLCYRYCARAASGLDRFIEPCRIAYDKFNARPSEPATTSAGETTDAARPVAVTRREDSAQAEVHKVTVMGVSLCGDVVEAGEYLEGQGYANAAMYARSLRTIRVSKRVGSDNYDFNINYGGPPKRDSIYLMHFGGSFQDGPNLFESEKAKFEQSTGIELTCKSYRTGPKETRLECKHPAGEADRSRPGFSYSITHNEGQKSFFVDASAWGYDDCG